jgi:hypothetical protein
MLHRSLHRRSLPATPSTAFPLAQSDPIQSRVFPPAQGAFRMLSVSHLAAAKPDDVTATFCRICVRKEAILKGECCGIDGSLRSFSVATRISFGRSGWIRLYWWIRSLVVDDVLIGAFCSHTAGYVILRNCSSNRFSSERSQPRYYPIGMTVLLFFWKHRAISLFRAC